MYRFTVAKYLFIMPKHKLCVRPPLRHMDHLITLYSVIMVPRQPSLEMTIFIVLPHVVLVGSENPRSRLGHVHLQDTKTRGMARSVVQSASLGDPEKTTRERFPIDFKIQIMREVDRNIRLGGNA